MVEYNRKLPRAEEIIPFDRPFITEVIAESYKIFLENTEVKSRIHQKISEKGFSSGMEYLHRLYSFRLYFMISQRAAKKIGELKNLSGKDVNELTSLLFRENIAARKSQIRTLERLIREYPGNITKFDVDLMHELSKAEPNVQRRLMLTYQYFREYNFTKEDVELLDKEVTQMSDISEEGYQLFRKRTLGNSLFE